MIPAIANHLWQSTLFAAAAGVLALLLKNNEARIRHRIWLAASLKFLIPFAWLISIGQLVTWTDRPAPVRHPVSIIVEEVSQPFAPSAPHSEPATAAIVWILWTSGFFCVTLSWIISATRIRAALRHAKPLALESPIPVWSSPARLEPGVFGILRPVLLMPEDIARRLTPDQLRAVIAHECSHVRRHDNLISAIHCAVQAIFWFHPLVWWIGARLLEERERACDEEVLRLGNPPEIYAESILKICDLYLEAPAACISGVSGGHLKRRIEQIMSIRHAGALDPARRTLLAASAIAAIAGPLVFGLMTAPVGRAQSADPDNAAAPAFDVASIKPAKPGTRGWSIRPLTGGRVVTQNTTLRMLLGSAYQLYDFQITGGPKWIDSARFDIEAKANTDVAAGQVRSMLRRLLAERFGLVTHRETKDLPVYALLINKNGSKMKPSNDSEGAPQFRVFMRRQITAKNVSLEPLVEALSFLMGRPVVDNTGLKGAFDYKLEWSPDQSQNRGDDEPLAPDPDHPSIFVALQEQLGLKLEARKAPVQILVIDRAELPAAN